VELLYSPYYLLGGLYFRLILSHNLEKNTVGLFLQCGGPHASGKKQSGMWSCAVKYHLTLLHPSKWAALDIDTDAATSGILPPNYSQLVPALPKDHVSVHHAFFNNDNHTGSGTGKWAAHALLQPGLFCDRFRNFVVTCELDLHNTYKIIEENVYNEISGDIKCVEFEQALEERAAVVEKLVKCDLSLRECKSPGVVLVLENEIKNLERALDALPPLDSFF